MFFWHLGLTAAIVFVTLGRRRIDYRVVLLGSVLPDLIDKPIGRVFFEDRFQSSHVYGHTLLFPVVLLLGVQLFLRGDRARRWFVLPIAVVIHLVLDGMWSDPITLFWPAFTTQFPKALMESYWLHVLQRPLQYPLEAIKELIGVAALVYFAWAFRLNESDPRRKFLHSGRLLGERGNDLPEQTPPDDGQVALADDLGPVP